MAGHLELDFTFRGAKRAPSFGPKAGMRLLLAGDFSGRGARGVLTPGDLGQRPLLRVDPDNFDGVMNRLAPRLVLSGPADDRPPEALAFGCLDDFHPDQLAARLEVFAGFRALRERLLDASTFAQTAAALEPAPTVATPAEDTLARLLGVEPRRDTGADISGFLKQVVAPHITAAPDARQPRLVAAVDQAAGQHLRSLLHHPAFQRLEAAWRALHRVVTSVETDGLTVFLLDVSREELAADLARRPDGSGLHQRLADAEPPWSMLALDETFGTGAADVTLLGSLGAVAAQVGAPLVAAADPRADWSALPLDDAARWHSLRQSPQARFIGLALPRWLLRQPYGAKTDPVESFAFEELAEGRTHAGYLWGNPAFACALLAGAAFRESGAEMSLGEVAELGDLPCHTYRQDGESHMQPCAEVLMPERVMTALLGRGLMPLVSAADRPALRVARFQSIADPPAPLAGPWR
jgi:type VI secretion system protein ImpC